MKKFFTYLLVLVAFSLLSCTESYDDSAIRSDLNALEARVAKLEELCKQMNTNISSLQTIVSAQQNNDYITGVTPIVKDGKEVGYTITFSKSKPITIYHGKDGANGTDGADGKDGKDGYTPVIGVLKDTDGIYYWTLDGEWLVDADGNKIKAQGIDGKDGQDGTVGEAGKDGADGKDGITPQLKIENNYWYISYDNGASWTQLGKATGDKGDKGDKGDVGLVGDSMFTDVDYSNEEYVIFTLSNGTTVKLPTWSAFEALRTLCNQMNTNISALQTIVSALQNNDYVTSVTPVSENGKVVGYTINFSKSNPVTIYHGKDGANGTDGADGKDGKDGYTPVIGVLKDTDDIYYWTLDGEWLVDADGNKIKAQGIDGKDGQDSTDGEAGKDGADGKDGITPQLKIENNYWYISYDNGASWTQLGKATGDKGDKGDKGDVGLVGDSMFTDVDYSNEEYVIFTLSNGTTVKLPTWSAFEALRTLCNQMNTNIEALQTIVSALQNNDYVTGVTPMLENGTVVGYTINFTKSNPVTIYHGKDGANGADGKDGKDGYSPQIGVKQDADDVYYWTLDGEWLVDADGNKIKAQGADGKDGHDGTDGENGTNGSNGQDGKDGITPQLKIENNYWFISYDYGQSWTLLGKATGEDGKDGANGSNGANGENGDSFFKGVDATHNEYVIITLADGTEIKLPTWSAFEALRTLCNQMNTNIEALQTIVEAIQDNDYVKSVTPILEDGKEIGYTITFTKSGSVTIYHGKNGSDGANGHSPAVSIKQDSDNLYYWTIDGEWLLDANGNKIKAVGVDGENGIDAITPQLKIEGGYWYISYDNGSNWTQLGQATGDKGEQGEQGEQGPQGDKGERGDDFFQSVTEDEFNVYLTLTDDTIITIPKGTLLDITFNASDLVVMSPLSTREINYTVESIHEKVTVEVTSSADIKAKVVADDATGKSGKIVIKSGAALDEYSKVIVFVSNGEKVVMKRISFEQAGLEISDGATQSIDAVGGNATINFMTNIDWEVVIPSDAKSWISVAPKTRAMVEHNVTLAIAPNTMLGARSAIVKIISADGGLSIEYTITQKAFDSISATTPENAGWQTNDYISVFAGNARNQQFKYVGTKGSNAGEFEAVATSSGSAAQVAAHYAVYPYNAAYTLSADGKLTIPFPATQSYVAGGYSRALNTLVGVSQNTANTDITLRPLGAYLCVKLWGKEQTIKSVIITSKNGEAIAGTATVTPAYNANPTCTLSGSANSITMNCNEVTIGTAESSATPFWFIVPPVALANGYTVKVVGFYGGEQTLEFPAATFVAGSTYNISAEVTFTTDGPGMGVGGWGDGGNVEGEI